MDYGNLSLEDVFCKIVYAAPVMMQCSSVLEKKKIDLC